MLSRIILRIILFSLVLGCNAQEPKKETTTTETTAQHIVVKPENFAKAEVIKKINCTADASQSYALYLPKDYNAETKKGAIFFFDPHGDGALPLEKYKSLAESLNFIFVGSNNSKNGNDWPTTQNVCDALFSDCQKRLNIDAQQIYVVGFSGGAKVACYALSQFGFVSGALAQSAMLPIQTNNLQSKKSIVGMAGTSDMNYTDVVNGMDALSENIFTKRTLLFHGKHEWCSVNDMETGLQSLMLMSKNIENKNILVSFEKNILQKIKTESDLILKVQYLKTANDLLTGKSNVSVFAKQLNEITNSAEYNKQLRIQQTLLTEENSIKNQIGDQISRGDIASIEKTYDEIEPKSKMRTPQSAMYSRVAGYMSLAAYSLSNRNLYTNPAEAARWVSLYKHVDKTNTEAWYFGAIVNMQQNNEANAVADMLKAIGLGFNDVQRFAKEPALASLNNNPSVAAAWKK